ncbi:MAG: hypothetical protein EOO10_25485 [Chitinophagaceae bacterium]|nr:MAG: hypothetical protein EOO10_25485 [Chitinophagaceae bacterium]
MVWFFRQVKKSLIMTMKGSRSQNNMQNKSMASHRPRPENKDDLDSRSNEEQDTKGTDVTHNEKQTRSDRKNVKNG